MKTFFFLFTLLLTMLSDLLIGNFGFSVSLTVWILIYFYGSFGSKTVFAAAVLIGLLLDLCYARPAAFSTIILLGAVSAGICFVPEKEYRHELLRSLPAGAVSGGIFVVCNAIAIWCIYGKAGYPAGVFPQLICAMLAGVIIFPVIIVILDTVALRLNLPRYLIKKGSGINESSNFTPPPIPIETASRRRRKK